MTTQTVEHSVNLPSWPLENSLVIVTGTHSAGKSTLVAGLEQGKLSELGDDYPFAHEYADDLGYGVIDSPSGQRFIITVPEAARWLADKTAHPELLGENYSLPFQYYIDALSTYRIAAAVDSTGAVMKELLKRRLLKDSQVASLPLIVSDRGPLDGVIYSTERINDRDTNVIPDSDGHNEFPRAGHAAEWTRQTAGLILVSDEADIPFEKDVARADDELLRLQIARRVLLNYSAILPKDSLIILSGSPEERLAETTILLAGLHRVRKGIRIPMSDSQLARFQLK